MTACYHGAVSPKVCPDCSSRPSVGERDVAASVRLTERERLRAALAPLARAWREVEARGAAGDLLGSEPVKRVHLRAAAWALDEEDNGDG